MDSTFSQTDNAKSRKALYAYIGDTLKDHETFHFMEFRFLNRLNIVQLQNKLVTLKAQIHQDQIAPDSSQLQETLKEYTGAIRDYMYLRDLPAVSIPETTHRSERLDEAFPEFLTRPAGKLTHRLFNSRYHYLYTPSPPPQKIQNWLRKVLPLGLTYSSKERQERPLEFEEGRKPREISYLVDSLGRFVGAFAGVAFLTVPMIIMLYPSQSLTKSIVTTVLASLIFGLCISIGMDASNKDTMVSTATYAAVLVVFVGTSLSSQPSGAVGVNNGSTAI